MPAQHFFSDSVFASLCAMIFTSGLSEAEDNYAIPTALIFLFSVAIFNFMFKYGKKVWNLFIASEPKLLMRREDVVCFCVPLEPFADNYCTSEGCIMVFKFDNFFFSDWPEKFL